MIDEQTHQSNEMPSILAKEEQEFLRCRSWEGK